MVENENKKETTNIRDGGGVTAAGRQSSGLVTSKVIETKWNVIPGATLRFFVGLALSGDLANEREKIAGLLPEEKTAALPAFRLNLLADIVEKEPEGFPDFPSGEMDTLPERVKSYFGQTDGRGRQPFQRLIESVIDEYWGWALPSPISSAYESVPTKPDISIKS